MDNLMMMGKNERLQYVLENIEKLPKEEQFNIFRETYISADMGFSNVDIKKVKKIYKGYTPKLPKKIQEKETVTVYRGGTEYGVFYGRALSWSLSFEVAEWFANRDPRNVNVRYVARAEINKKYILDYNNERKEQEVLLIPDKLENIKLVPFKKEELTEEEQKAALMSLYIQNQN